MICFVRTRLLPLILGSLTLLMLIGCDSAPADKSWLHDNQGLYAADLSGDGRYVLTATVLKSAILWDLSSNQQKHTWTHQSGTDTDISHVAISHNGRVAVTTSGREFAAWDVQTGRSLAYWELPSVIVDIDLSHNGKYALIGYFNHNAQLIDVHSGFPVWTVNHAAAIHSVAVSKDYQYALVGCDDNTASLWDIKAAKRIHLWEDKSRIRKVAISPDNRLALTSSPYQSIKVWDIPSGELKHELKAIQGFFSFMSRPIINVSSARFSNDSQFLLTGAPPRNLYLWNMVDGSLSNQWVVPKNSHWKPTSAIIYASAFSTDNQTIFAEASNGVGYQWKVE